MMFAKTWVLIILAPHFSILQTSRVYFSHSSCHHLLFTLLRQRSSLSCNKSLVQHSGLFHMMPKWWTSATCRDLPMKFQQSYLSNDSQVVRSNASSRNPRSHDRRCSLVGGPRRTDRLTDGDFSNHWFQFIHCKSHQPLFLPCERSKYVSI